MIKITDLGRLSPITFRGLAEPKAEASMGKMKLMNGGMTETLLSGAGVIGLTVAEISVVALVPPLTDVLFD